MSTPGTMVTTAWSASKSFALASGGLPWSGWRVTVTDIRYAPQCLWVRRFLVREPGPRLLCGWVLPRRPCFGGQGQRGGLGGVVREFDAAALDLGGVEQVGAALAG